MIEWRLDAASGGLRTVVGERAGGSIRIDARNGCGLYGPYLDMPAGRVSLRLILTGRSRGRAKLEITGAHGRDVLLSRMVDLDGTDLVLPVSLELTEPVSQLEVRLFCRRQVEATIEALEIRLERDHVWRPLDPSRPVGQESGKTYADKIASGFFDRYMSGPSVMEIGYRGYDHETVPIVPQAIGVDVGYPGYDGRRFPFSDASFDAIYSSHCFEHIEAYREVLRDWYRLLKVGGFLVIIVPHQHLFERKRHLPSKWNGDHKRFYTPRSLLAEIEEAFEENSYRIRHLIENDQGFDYSQTPSEATTGCYEIELVIEKIAKPRWTLDEGWVRTYSPRDFLSRFGCERPSPWELRLDLAHEASCVVWGPYHALGPGEYEAEFLFEWDGAERLPEITFDVARGGVRRGSITLAPQPAPAQGSRFVIPFSNDEDGALFEYRIFTPNHGSPTRPRFRGVDVRYARIAA